MSAHTPGPWIVFHADADGANDVLPAGSDGHIALGIENEANARLIAAAPDMLAVLRFIVDHAEPNAQAVAAIRRVARAAIAKAEGRT